VYAGERVRAVPTGLSTGVRRGRRGRPAAYFVRLKRYVRHAVIAAVAMVLTFSSAEKSLLRGARTRTAACKEPNQPVKYLASEARRCACLPVPVTPLS
jgi:hypothetical protein